MDYNDHWVVITSMTVLRLHHVEIALLITLMFMSEFVMHACTDFCWNQAELLILDVWSKTIEAGRRVQGSRDEFSYPQASGAFPSNFSPSLLRSPQKSLVVPSKPIVTQVTEHTRHGQVQFSLPLHSFDWIWRWHSLNFINKHWYVSNFCYRFNF